jgi:hypothetical protein
MKRRNHLMTWENLWLFALLTSLLLAVGVLSGSTIGADNPSPTPTPVREAIPWNTMRVRSLETAVEVEKRAWGHPKLGSSLNQLLKAYHRGGLAEAQSFATRHIVVLDNNRVQVEMVILSEAMGDVRKAIETAGGEYQGHYKTLLQALVPINALESLAQRPDVQFIREPQRAMPLVISEGVGASNASAWHAAGYDGSGVKVAIVDAGFDGYTSLLGTDLPAFITARDYTGAGMGGTVHGTACAEVVYDVAPGASMYLSKVSTVVELSNAINDLIADGVDIISMSLGWTIDGPGDGTGTLASIVNNARSNGIFYATAAGNDAEVSWSGQYVNHPSVSGTHQWPHGGNVNCFGPGTDFSCYVVSAGTSIKVGLHWDDWTSVTQDYDLYLLKWTGSTWTIVAASENWQNGGAGQTPEEFINYIAPSSTAYAVLVAKYSATRDVCFRMVAPKMGHLDEWVEQRSLTFPADSPDAITVGAVDVNRPYPLESYSSRGPTFGPDGTCSGGSTKPDIAAYANVSTASYGAGVFNGTSAATPHMAGAAALVKQRYTGYSASQLQGYLESNAIDLGDPGKDNLYGSGRLYLPEMATPTPTSEPPPPPPADLKQASDLEFSPPDPSVGDTVHFWFKVRNDGGEAIEVTEIGPFGYGPNHTPWDANRHGTLEIAANGGEETIHGYRIFEEDEAGIWTVDGIHYQLASDPEPRSYYDLPANGHRAAGIDVVVRGPSDLRQCLDLEIHPDPPIMLGEKVRFCTDLCNYGDQPSVFKYFGPEGRDPDARNWDAFIEGSFSVPPDSHPYTYDMFGRYYKVGGWCIDRLAVQVNDNWLTRYTLPSDRHLQSFCFDVVADPDHLITFVEVIVSDREYRVVENLGVGDRYYTDRDYTILNLPKGFEDLTWIMTSNEDDQQTREEFLYFALNNGADVCIAYDQRVDPLPNWMDNFEDTGHLLEVSDWMASPLSIYCRHYPLGKVVLGGNLASGAGHSGPVSNYVVLAKTPCLLFGDFDSSGQVDVVDIQRVASRWRMTDDDPDWDARYDLNGDGIITVVDIMLVAAHWDERCE